ncbi:CDP-alcohol phosphatidyltransferase family protein [Paracoccus sp. Ld10]|uniref:CDP-alcohol phosphatidyltransferase family protein n=1 Tax=Paracoccus sp. Ld10 TaxID=649158 RepID=UPI003869D29B
MRLSYVQPMQISRDDLSAPPIRQAKAAGRRLPGGLVLAIPTGLALNLGVGVLVLGQGTGALMAGVVYLAGAALVCVAMRRHYPHARLGSCNAVTLMRMALTAALIAPLVGGVAAGWAVAAVATISLSLDGVDGWLARRSGLCSGFGARFDMEVDAALALILCLHALVGSPVGPEILALGVMRYLFIGAGLIWPWITAPLEVSYARKGVCVLQLATLIALQVPVLSDDLAITLARIAAAALIWSFGRDVLWLRGNR